MAPSVKEIGVLKLVYPGGLTEIHSKPITADEVIQKNPKHCVARPDVFTNPWIVVRPESVLKLGSTFYIVPHHTMRKLMLKAQEQENEQGKQMNKPSKDDKSVEITDKGNRGKSIFKHGSSCGTRSTNKQSRVACDDHGAMAYSSVDLSYFNSLKEDITSSHTADKKEKLKSDMDSCGSKVSVLSGSDPRKSYESTVRKEKTRRATTPNNRIMPRIDDMEVPVLQRRGYPDDLQSKEIISPKDRHQLEREPERLQILEKPVNNEVSDQQQSNNASRVHISENSPRIKGLKSCLKPPTSTYTSSNLRVRFMFPGDEEKILRTRLWLSEINPETP